MLCAGDTTCSPEDGLCRCNGTTCSADESCSCLPTMPGCQPFERVCVTSTACDGVGCMGGSTCDPADGRCKCGGPAGPLCSATQSCNAGQCIGGCGSPCARGTSCDSTALACRCGGQGGNACDAAEVCVSRPGQYACRLECTAATECPPLQACFIDVQSAARYCAVPSGLLAEGEPCRNATECFDGRPLHCAGLGPQQPFGICRASCDVPCAAGRHCVEVAGTDAGLCVP